MYTHFVRKYLINKVKLSNNVNAAVAELNKDYIAINQLLAQLNVNNSEEFKLTFSLHQIMRYISNVKARKMNSAHYNARIAEQLTKA